MDEIRRKLALIDEQLTPGGLRRRLVSTAPLFFPALGLMTGIVLQDRLLRHLPGFDPSWLPWFWLIALSGFSQCSELVDVDSKFHASLLFLYNIIFLLLLY